MASKEEDEKSSFFNQLYSLGTLEEEEEEDMSNISSLLKQSRKPKPDDSEPSRPPAKSLSPLGEPAVQPVSQTASAPGLPANHAIVPQTSDLGRSPQSTTALNTRVEETSRKSGRRKRVEAPNRIPDAQKIFNGHNFYFIPNDDVAPARRLKISKAIEYGATWLKQWGQDVSHVIVDRNITYRDILSFLKISHLPADVTLVNETYPIECISFGFLMNPQQTRFRVEVTEEPTPRHSDVVQLGGSSTEPSIHPPQNDTGQIGQRESCDALDEAISQTKAIEHLPLDSEEEDDASGQTASDNSESEGNAPNPKKRKLNKPSSSTSWQDRFNCMHKHDGTDTSDNPNARTIEILQQMVDYYDRMNDKWRIYAYRKAIAVLRKETVNITTKEEALSLPSVGERLASKIEEIVLTNRLRRLDNVAVDTEDSILQCFLNIYGVGLSQASKWVSQGFRTLTDLQEKADLSTSQKIGIAHYDDFLARIPRSEVEAHGTLVHNLCQSIDPELQVIVMGSYRRGAADSGDIDLIITKPDARVQVVREVMLSRVIPTLFDRGFLKAGLATTHNASGTKWHGASALPGSPVWRRIDFLFVPWDELGAALIYFTGNDLFNRSIRLLARKKGMRLNQRGLWQDVLRSKSGERITQGVLVEGKSEKKIFELLGVPWRPPEHRIC
ncbi:MAG: hypothetical protein M1819_000208 [Sarea resinae]|nr:MAG: hypothetical protein M1819_000208 [Sarea resinae]